MKQYRSYCKASWCVRDSRIHKRRGDGSRFKEIWMVAHLINRGGEKREKIKEGMKEGKKEGKKKGRKEVMQGHQVYQYICAVIYNLDYTLNR